MIQSFSDIITNSSSEVFIITTDKHNEVIAFIKKACDLFGVDMDEIMRCESVIEDSSIDYVKKGDLIISSTRDNSIPGIIMDIIDELNWSTYFPNIKPLNIKNVTSKHIE